MGWLGGEEFAILLRGITITDAMECAERVRQSVAKIARASGPRIGGDRELGFAAVAGGNPHGSVAAADAALYCAKESASNRCFAATGLSEEPPII
ncbi:MAG: diguanylate cyclase [Sandarakinorhabdus sp.]|nr:diguanylate cyclase [Sandarakinorhabdus sp.]